MKKITLIIPLDPKKEVEFLDSVLEQKSTVKMIIERGNNPSRNRNRGICKAKSEFIAFINAHTLLSPDWSGKVLKFFKNHHEIDIVGGPQLHYKKDNLFAKASSYALSSPFGTAYVYSRYSKGQMNLHADETYLTSANLICKKKVVNKIKFDESLYPGEDPKFIRDAIKKGFRIAYSPDIIVYNRKRSDIFSLAKQIFNYGRVRPKKESLKETLYKPYFLIPSFFVVYLAFLPLLTYFNYWLLLPLSFYLSLNIVFSYYEAVRRKSMLIFYLLPFIFFVIHFSYGAGFIYGILKK